MDLSFVVVSGFFFVMTEHTVNVVVVFLEVGKDVVEIEVLVVAGGVGICLVNVTIAVMKEIITDNVVEWTDVRSWLLTDAGFWI